MQTARQFSKMVIAIYILTNKIRAPVPPLPILGSFFWKPLWWMSNVTSAYDLNLLFPWWLINWRNSSLKSVHLQYFYPFLLQFICWRNYDPLFSMRTWICGFENTAHGCCRVSVFYRRARLFVILCVNPKLEDSQSLPRSMILSHRAPVVPSKWKHCDSAF